MCGILGIYSESGDASADLALAMADAIVHRGPDDGGVYCDGQIALGSRRLSIIDLSPAGHMPMQFAEAGMWIVYNGEVYNFRELRAELEARNYRFDTGTDTEVVLKAYHCWGVDAFQRLRGMFGLAIWDKSERTLTLARDPFGIKPVYVARCGDDVVFGSELKSLRLHPRFPTEINPSALSFYLAHLYVPEPHSICSGVERLAAGHWMTFGPKGRSTGRFYHPAPAAANRKRSYRDTVAELIDVLQESVKAHLVADVPVGAFLSGGVDSSVVVALMRRAGQGDIKTFTIGFEGEFASYDEREYAAQVAGHFETDHREIVVRHTIVDSVEKRLIEGFDEPFANPAALIADTLSEFTRSEVKVALGGVGGDEFFGGYPRYRGMLMLEHLDRVPTWLRNLARSAFSALPNSPDRRNLVERARRLFDASQSPISGRYEALTRFTSSVRFTELISPDLVPRIDDTAVLPAITVSHGQLLEHLLAVDRATYLPGDLLTYTDRASMTHSLEVRTPFCDIAVDRFARTIPAEYKIRGRELKFILKDAFKTMIPRSALYRPKKGFSVPIGEWLQGPLRPMLDQVFSPDNLRRQPYIEGRRARQLLADFDAGNTQNAFVLWAIFIFLLWDSRRHR